jgi:hypothetical protein
LVTFSLSAISYVYQIGELCEIKNFAANSYDQHTFIDFGSAQPFVNNFSSTFVDFALGAVTWLAKS